MTLTKTPNFSRLLLLILLLLFLPTVIFYDLSTGGGLKSWLAPQPIFAVVAIIVGFIALGWQLDKQHANTLDANRRQERDRLRLHIYQTLAERIEATNVPLAEVTNLPATFLSELRLRSETTAAVGRSPIRRSEYSFRLFQQALKKGHDAVISLMAILELYEIAMPEFIVFRQRFAEYLASLRSDFDKFTKEASWFLESGELGPIKWPPIAADFELLEQLGRRVMGTSVDLTGCIWDLRVETQNYLLGGLFPDRRVPPRTPGDPSVVVTSVQTGRV